MDRNKRYSDVEKLQYSLDKSFEYIGEEMSQDYKEGYVAAISWVKNYVERGKKFKSNNKENNKKGMK